MASANACFAFRGVPGSRTRPRASGERTCFGLLGLLLVCSNCTCHGNHLYLFVSISGVPCNSPGPCLGLCTPPPALGLSLLLFLSISPTAHRLDRSATMPTEERREQRRLSLSSIRQGAVGGYCYWWLTFRKSCYTSTQVLAK